MQKDICAAVDGNPLLTVATTRGRSSVAHGREDKPAHIVVSVGNLRKLPCVVVVEADTGLIDDGDGSNAAAAGAAVNAADVRNENDDMRRPRPPDLSWSSVRFAFDQTCK